MECEDEKARSDELALAVEKHERTTAWLAPNRAIPSILCVHAQQRLLSSVNTERTKMQEKTTSCDVMWRIVQVLSIQTQSTRIVKTQARHGRSVCV